MDVVCDSCKMLLGELDNRAVVELTSGVIDVDKELKSLDETELLYTPLEHANADTVDISKIVLITWTVDI